LLLHLGRPSVLENVGLYCERITGLPVIPGSAVKGLISTWACWDANSNRIYNPALDGTVDLERRRALFDTPAKAVLGDNSDTGSSEGGQIIFLGAFPAKPPQLGLDIVTPHVDAAGHDRNPVPNPFLAIEPGVPWKFLMLVCQRGVTRPAAHLLDTAAAWLTDALAQLGLGAKTAAGYGRFVSPEGFKAGIQVPARPEMALTPAQQAAAAAMARDYPNEAEFANRVLKKLNPGQLDQLKGEIPLLQKPENEQWRAKLLGKLRENKDVRKRLRGKEWFPQEWADI
jgi:CRISPR type III-B/RAMP module RAMP protein Cmr6